MDDKDEIPDETTAANERDLHPLWVQCVEPHWQRAPSDPHSSEEFFERVCRHLLDSQGIRALDIGVGMMELLTETDASASPPLLYLFAVIKAMAHDAAIRDPKWLHVVEDWRKIFYPETDCGRAVRVACAICAQNQAEEFQNMIDASIARGAPRE